MSENPAKYSFHLQMLILVHYLQLLDTLKTRTFPFPTILLVERDLLSSAVVFASQLLARGYLSEHEQPFTQASFLRVRISLIILFGLTLHLQFASAVHHIVVMLKMPSTLSLCSRFYMMDISICVRIP